MNNDPYELRASGRYHLVLEKRLESASRAIFTLWLSILSQIHPNAKYEVEQVC